MLANEVAMRMMLAHSLERVAHDAVANQPRHDLPARQNRRTPLIEAALEPARGQFMPAALKNLSARARAADRHRGDGGVQGCAAGRRREARRVKRWAIRALVDAARKPQYRQATS